MLIAVNLFPITTDMLAEVPPGVDPASLSRPLVAFTAFATIILVSLYAGGAARLWAPLFGIVAGTLVAAPSGMLNWTPVLDAAWFGLPRTGWPGLDVSFDGRFFGLLVPFVIVTVIGAIETYGHAIAIQRVSHRTAVPVDCWSPPAGSARACGWSALRGGLIVCISFWVGLGFQFGVIFPDHLPQWSGGTLDNGMAAGGIVAMVLTLLVSLKQRARHDVLEPSVRSLPKLRAALDRAAERAGWDELAVNRLQLAGEEAFLYLLERQEESKPQPVRVAVRPVDDVLQVELAAGPDDVNLEDRLGRLDEDHEIARDVGPRILRHVAKEVKHEQFYDLDVLTVTVDTRPLV